MNILSDGLFVPVMLIGLMGWLVPKGLSMLLPEGVGPLFLNAVLSAVLVSLLASALFFVLYVMRGATVTVLMEQGLADNLIFFGRLGLSTAIVWGPIVILSVAGLPRHWTTKTW